LRFYRANHPFLRGRFEIGCSGVQPVKQCASFKSNVAKPFVNHPQTGVILHIQSLGYLLISLRAERAKEPLRLCDLWKL
jgi:hypothetical protein